MKKLTFITTILLFCGCSPKISKYFEHNKYIKNYNIHLVNDSLQLYFKTPGDITYSTDKNELKKIIRKGKIKPKDSVLVYGKSNEPSYEYYVTISENHKQNNTKHFVIFDTIINKKTIQFIGNPLTKNSNSTLKIGNYSACSKKNIVMNNFDFLFLEKQVYYEHLFIIN